MLKFWPSGALQQHAEHSCATVHAQREAVSFIWGTQSSSDWLDQSWATRKLTQRWNECSFLASAWPVCSSVSFWWSVEMRVWCCSWKGQLLWTLQVRVQLCRAVFQSLSQRGALIRQKVLENIFWEGRLWDQSSPFHTNITARIHRRSGKSIGPESRMNLWILLQAQYGCHQLWACHKLFSGFLQALFIYSNSILRRGFSVLWAVLVIERRDWYLKHPHDLFPHKQINFRQIKALFHLILKWQIPACTTCTVTSFHCIGA